MERTKEDVLRAAIDVLPETLLVFRIADLHDFVRPAIEQAIIDAPTLEPRALQNFAADKLEELLEKRSVDPAPVTRTFLAKMKRDMGME